jgi:acyl carrier protein
METEQIFNKVLEIIKEFVKDQKRLENVKMETTIIEDLNVNSARLVDIIIQAEDMFDIEIDDGEADQIMTVGDAVSIVEKKLSAA